MTKNMIYNMIMIRQNYSKKLELNPKYLIKIQEGILK